MKSVASSLVIPQFRHTLISPLFYKSLILQPHLSHILMAIHSKYRYLVSTCATQLWQIITWHLPVPRYYSILQLWQIITWHLYITLYLYNNKHSSLCIIWHIYIIWYIYRWQYIQSNLQFWKSTSYDTLLSLFHITCTLIPDCITFHLPSHRSFFFYVESEQILSVIYRLPYLSAQTLAKSICI